LLETLNGLRRANSLARSDNEDQINKVNMQASVLPITERQLLGIERKFKLNNELYTFLLETRANLQMQKASNTADSEIIDPADDRFSVIVAPNPTTIYFISLIAGMGIPLMFFFLRFIFNKKLTIDDIKRMTEKPVIGNIPHNTENKKMVVLEYPNSSIAEAYRLIRSRLQFFIKDTVSPVIVITSSMPAEGKTYTAINLASAYSLTGKRTLLVGFDLRKPRIYMDLNIDNEKGVSTWLIGKDSIEEIIRETSFKNLSVIPAGPIPPNPSELISSPKTEELIHILKSMFDYIIIDTSPLGLVSDTYHLASIADTCLLLVRPGVTLRDIYGLTLSALGNTQIKSLCVIINDLHTDISLYSYGEKFGYTNGSGLKKRRSIFRKEKVKITTNGNL
jgi:capsular exopolysaccharide synthesis family protein